MTENLTREEMYPLWARLTAATDAARELFRAGGSEVAFRAKLASLGFDGPGIDTEVDQNRPRSPP